MGWYGQANSLRINQIKNYHIAFLTIKIFFEFLNILFHNNSNFQFYIINLKYHLMSIWSTYDVDHIVNITF